MGQFFLFVGFDVYSFDQDCAVVVHLDLDPLVLAAFLVMVKVPGLVTATALLGNLVPCLASLRASGLRAMNQNGKVFAVIPDVGIVMVNFQTLLCRFILRQDNLCRAQAEHGNQSIMRAAIRGHKLEVDGYLTQPLCPKRQRFSVAVKGQIGIEASNQEPSVKVRLIEKVAALMKADKLC